MKKNFLFWAVLLLILSGTYGQGYMFRSYINRIAYLSISEDPRGNEANLMSTIRFVNITRNPELQRDVSRCFAQYNIATRQYEKGDSLLGLIIAHYSLASDTLGMAYCKLLKGYSLLRQGDNTCIPLLQQSMNYGYLWKNEVMIVRSANTLGMALDGEGETEKARNIHEKAVGFCRSSGDSLMLSAALRGYAYHLRNVNDLKHVASYLGEAIKIDLALKRFNDFDRNLVNLASIMIELQYPKDAIDICKAASFFAARYNHDDIYYYIYSNMAEAYMHLNNITKAFAYSYKAKNEALKFDNQYGIANADFLLGEVYYNSGDKNKANECYTKSAERYRQIGEENALIIIFDRLGTLHMDKHEYQEAIGVFEQGKKLAHVYNDRVTYKDLNSGLAFAYEYTGHFKDAYFCLRTEKNITDSMFNEEISTKISALDSNFEVEKKQYVIRYLDKENQLINQKLRTNRIMFFLLVFIAVVLILLGLQLYKSTKTRHQLEVTERNMQALRSQMNPHFFFNVLNGIQAQIYKGEKTEAAKYLQKTAALMREILDSSIEDYISLENEVQMMENYLVLQKMRMGDLFDYNITTDSDAEPDWVLLPSMLAQPFIENALKHAFKKIEHKGLISVIYTIVANTFEIRVEDNGQGFTQDVSAPEHVSRAIKITRQRLQMYEKKTRFSHSLDIQSSKNGVIVVIRGFVKAD